MKYIIELTNVCNLDCEMCPRRYADMELGYMSIELWNALFSWIPKGSTILPFWRGESTLHPGFREMIGGLEEYDVVLATNGTYPEAVIDVIPYLSAINVSIHNEESYEGYLKIKNHIHNGRPTIIGSMVEGEREFVGDSRIYKRHTVDGIWGKVEGIEKKDGPLVCSRLNESVFSWDGKMGRCCYVWDMNLPKAQYPDSVCLNCDQWMGDGKTL